MMDVGLIAPLTLQRSDFVESGIVSDRVLATHLPLGILTLAAALRDRGLRVHFVDLNTLFRDFSASVGLEASPDFCSYAVGRLSGLRIDVLGFGTICSSFPLTLRIASLLRKENAFGSVPVVLGGPQASVVDEAVLEHFHAVDFIVRGEAEDSFPALLDAIGAVTSPGVEAIPGISFRRGASVVRTPSPPPLADMDRLPFPAYDLFPYTRSARTIPVELGRGCPYACTFCSTNDFFRRRYRLRSPELTLSHMQRVRDEYGVTQFALVHDMFTVDRRRVVQFCQVVAAANEPFHWQCSARTDRVDDELLDIMQNAGCRGIFFGVETGSAQVQRTIKKNLDLSQAESAVIGVSQRGMSVVVSLIMGFPTETEYDLRDTIDVFIRSICVENASPQLHLLSPLAGTPIQREYSTNLLFDGTTSDISEAALNHWDWALVKQHPEIFPNFYTVPGLVPREFLVELREFIIHALAGWPLFLAGLHRCDPVVEIVRDLVAWRAARGKPNFGTQSRSDEIVSYLAYRYNSSMKRMVVEALVAIWQGVNNTRDQDNTNSPLTANTTGSTTVDWEHVPQTAASTAFVDMGLNYRSLKHWILHGGEVDAIERCDQLLAIQVNEDEATFREVSGLAKELLQRCDGYATVREIAIALRPSESVNSVEDVRLGLDLLAERGYISVKEQRMPASS